MLDFLKQAASLDVQHYTFEQRATALYFSILDQLLVAGKRPAWVAPIVRIKAA